MSHLFRKVVSILLTLILLASQLATPFTMALPEDPVLEKLKDQSEVALDKMEAVAETAIDKVDASTTNPEIEARLEQKSEEIQEYINTVQEKLDDADSKQEIKEVLEEAKKVVTLKVVSGATDYDNVLSEAVANVEGTKNDKINAGEAIMDTLIDSKSDTYSLMIKTAYTLEKTIALLKPYDSSISISDLFTEDGLNYYEATIDAESLLSQEILPDLEKGILPDTLLGIDIIKPEALKIGEVDLKGEDIVNPWGINYFGLVPYYGAINTTPIRVGIVDTGITYSHPDLKDRIDTSTAYDFVNDDTDATDDQGHGTHVAGTIGASINGSGIVGINPYVKIVPLKICDEKGFCPTYAVYKAISYAIDHNIQVINMSLGGLGNPATSSICQAIDAATKAGIIVVSAAGNANREVASYVPGGCTSAITVSAIDKNGARANFSNYGTGVDISAPGVGIYSTYLNNGYKVMDGTSMAAPHISGLVALLVAQKPGLNTDSTLQLLRAFPRATTSESTKVIAPGVDVPKLLESIGVKIPTKDAIKQEEVKQPIIVEQKDIVMSDEEQEKWRKSMEIQTTQFDLEKFLISDGLQINWDLVVSMYPGETKYAQQCVAGTSTSCDWNVNTGNQKFITVSYTNRIISITANSPGEGAVSIWDNKLKKNIGQILIRVLSRDFAISASFLNINANDNGTVEILSGNGGYTYSLSDSRIVSASMSGTKITLSGKYAGTSTLTIKDSAGKSATVNILIRSPLVLSGSTVTIFPDNTPNIVANISGGTGKGYSISGGSASIASGFVNSDGQITLRGIKAGNTSFTLSDNGNGTTIILGVVVSSADRELTLSKSSISILPGLSDSVQITSGNGEYTIKNSNTSALTAVLNGITIKLTSVGVEGSSSTITVTDKKGKTAVLKANVGATVKDLTTNTTSIKIVQGSTARVVITSGNGGYTLESTFPQVATAALVNGAIDITGLTPGQTLIVLRDAKKRVATINVEVTELIYEIVLDSNTISLKPGATKQVNILQGNGGYTVTSSRPSDVGATIEGSIITLKATPSNSGYAQIYVKDKKGRNATIGTEVERISLLNIRTVRWTPDQTTIVYSMDIPGNSFRETGLEYIGNDGKTYRNPVSNNTTSRYGADYIISIKNLESRVQPYYIDNNGKYITINPGNPQIQTYATPIQTASADDEVTDEEGMQMEDEAEKPIVLTDEEGNPLKLPAEFSASDEILPDITKPENTSTDLSDKPAESASNGEGVEINSFTATPDIKYAPAINAGQQISILLLKNTKSDIKPFSGMTLQYISGPRGANNPYYINRVYPEGQFVGQTVGRYTFYAYSDTDKRNAIAYIILDVYDGITFSKYYASIPANNQINTNVLSISGGLSNRYGIRGGHQKIATANVINNSVNIRGIGEGLTKFYIFDEMNPAIERSLLVRVGASKSISLSQSTLTLQPTNTGEILITNGNGGYTVSTSDYRVATAIVQDDAKILVTAGIAGKTTITVNDYSGQSIKFSVEVTGSNTLTINVPSLNLTANQSGTVYITSGNGGYILNSSRPEIATGTITGNTITITPKSAGTTIFAVQDVLYRRAELTVIISEGAKKLVVGPTSLSLFGTEKSGQSKILDGNGGYSVTSSDKTVATASVDGNTVIVKPVQGGESTITVTDSKNQSASITVEVNGGVRPLTLDRSAYNLTIGTTIKVSITNGNGGYEVINSDRSPVTGTIQGNILSITAGGWNGRSLGIVSVKDLAGQKVDFTAYVTSEVAPTEFTNISTAKWGEEDMSVYFTLNGTPGGCREVGIEYLDFDGQLYRHNINLSQTNFYQVYIDGFGRKVQPYFIDMNGNFYTKNLGKPFIETPAKIVSQSETTRINSVSEEGEATADVAVSDETIIGDTIDPSLLLDENGNPLVPKEVTVPYTPPADLLPIGRTPEHTGGEGVEINSASTNINKTALEIKTQDYIVKNIEEGKSSTLWFAEPITIARIAGSAPRNSDALFALSTTSYSISGQRVGSYVYGIYRTINKKSVQINTLYVYVYKPIIFSDNPLYIEKSSDWRYNIASVQGGSGYGLRTDGWDRNRMLDRVSLSSNGILSLRTISEGTTSLLFADSQNPQITRSLTVIIYKGKDLKVDKQNITLPQGTTAPVTITSGNEGYYIYSSRESVATATLSGTTITVTGVAKGDAQITLVDRSGRRTYVGVTVENPAISTAGIINDQIDISLAEDGITFIRFDVSGTYSEVGIAYVAADGKTKLHTFPINTYNSYYFLIYKFSTQIRPYVRDINGKYVFSTRQFASIGEGVSVASAEKITGINETIPFTNTIYPEDYQLMRNLIYLVNYHVSKYENLKNCLFRYDINSVESVRSCADAGDTWNNVILPFAIGWIKGVVKDLGSQVVTGVVFLTNLSAKLGTGYVNSIFRFFIKDKEMFGIVEDFEFGLIDSVFDSISNGIIDGLRLRPATFIEWGKVDEKMGMVVVNYDAFGQSQGAVAAEIGSLMYAAGTVIKGVIAVSFKGLTVIRWAAGAEEVVYQAKGIDDLVKFTSIYTKGILLGMEGTKLSVFANLVRSLQLIGLEAEYVKVEFDVWLANKFIRGFLIEDLVGGNNLGKTFPVIDRIIAQDRTIISIKSMDTTADSYQNGTKMYSTLKGYVDKLAGFTNKGEVTDAVYDKKILQLVIPGNTQLNNEQLEAIKNIIDYSKTVTSNKPITLKITILSSN